MLLFADRFGDHPTQTGSSLALDSNWKYRRGALASGSDHHLSMEGKIQALEWGRG